MNYNISSDKFQHPLLKPILKKLTEYFSKEDIRFFVIGATARDIIMQLHDEKSGRATHDLDIAISTNNWDDFKKIEDGIVNIEDFKKDVTQKQRFIYQDEFVLDIVPFGDIMEEDDKIFWPPEEEIAMSVLGFSEVNKSTEPVKIDDEIEIQVASLAGIFILKTVAWFDRHLKGNKDADDIGFIIVNYLNIHMERAIEENYDLYEAEDFDISSAGSRLIGRDISELLSDNESTKKKLSNIIKTEIEKEKESVLINQVLETHSNLNYDLVYKCLQEVLRGLED